MKVKLVVTLEVSKNIGVRGPGPNLQVACEAASEGVEEALNNAMNRGFNHRHSDAVALSVEKVEVVQADRYRADKHGRIGPRGFKPNDDTVLRALCHGACDDAEHKS
jgi:hypothetical protein